SDRRSIHRAVVRDHAAVLSRLRSRLSQDTRASLRILEHRAAARSRGGARPSRRYHAEAEAAIRKGTPRLSALARKEAPRSFWWQVALCRVISLGRSRARRRRARSRDRDGA